MAKQQDIIPRLSGTYDRYQLLLSNYRITPLPIYGNERMPPLETILRHDGYIL